MPGLAPIVPWATHSDIMEQEVLQAKVSCLNKYHVYQVSANHQTIG